MDQKELETILAPPTEPVKTYRELLQEGHRAIAAGALSLHHRVGAYTRLPSNSAHVTRFCNCANHHCNARPWLVFPLLRQAYTT